MVTGEGRYRQQATELLEVIVNSTQKSSFVPGGMKGTGSVIYALSVAVELLDAPEYGTAAAEMVRDIPDSGLDASGTLDVIGGTAGTLLAALACYERHGGAEVCARATACGDRLLNARVTVDGSKVWTTIDDEPTPGFAHGIAGIGYALSRLAAVVGEDRYAAAAREAFEYESDLDQGIEHPGQL